MNILKVYKKILWFCICINNNIHNVVGTLVQYILKLEINYLQALSQLLVHAQLRIEKNDWIWIRKNECRSTARRQSSSAGPRI